MTKQIDTTGNTKMFDLPFAWIKELVIESEEEAECIVSEIYDKINSSERDTQIEALDLAISVLKGGITDFDDLGAVDSGIITLLSSKDEEIVYSCCRLAVGLSRVIGKGFAARARIIIPKMLKNTNSDSKVIAEASKHALNEIYKYVGIRDRSKRTIPRFSTPKPRRHTSSIIEELAAADFEKEKVLSVCNQLSVDKVIECFLEESPPYMNGFQFFSQVLELGMKFTMTQRIKELFTRIIDLYKRCPEVQLFRDAISGGDSEFASMSSDEKIVFCCSVNKDKPHSEIFMQMVDLMVSTKNTEITESLAPLLSYDCNLCAVLSAMNDDSTELLNLLCSFCKCSNNLIPLLQQGFDLLVSLMSSPNPRNRRLSLMCIVMIKLKHESEFEPYLRVFSAPQKRLISGYSKKIAAG